LKDVNRGTVYDGPLVILVNGSSASASELVAGTLQDYNRALIVGSPTYGKATGQIVLPLDTTVNIQAYNGKTQAASYIKLTTFRLYRVNGTSAQIKGVIPDIMLPDPTEAGSKQREANEKFALQSSPVDANKYYTPLARIPFTDPLNTAKHELDSSAYFKAINKYIQNIQMPGQRKDISLFIDDFMQLHGEKNEPPEADDYSEKNHIYTVTNHAYEQRRVEANKNLKEANDELKENLVNDPYIKIGFRVAAAMIK
jgi:carboxyl-terminal processing protease